MLQLVQKIRMIGFSHLSGYENSKIHIEIERTRIAVAENEETEADYHLSGHFTRFGLNKTNDSFLLSIT